MAHDWSSSSAYIQPQHTPLLRASEEGEAKQSDTFRKILVLRAGKRSHEKVRNHLLRCHMVEADPLLTNWVPSVMIQYIDMRRAVVEDQVLCKMVLPWLLALIANEPCTITLRLLRNRLSEQVPLPPGKEPCIRCTRLPTTPPINADPDECGADLGVERHDCYPQSAFVKPETYGGSLSSQAPPHH